MEFSTINTREDLAAIAGTPEHDAFMTMLSGTLWRFEKNDTTQAWVAIADDSTIKRFGLSRTDFPGAVPPEPPVYIPPPSLAERVADALVVIEQFHAETVQKLVGNPTQVEKDTWALKLEAAGAITQKTTVSAAGQAFLAGAGMTTDAAKSAWAASVLAKATAYAQVVGLAERLRDTARTAVKAATDEATLKASLDAQRAAADAAVASLLKGT
ncbi:hypothetical protein [Polaromonas sp.]|uniref:hypothetical protein n=1 Tax=Polaromonas sp. TaxID=1869339 RepID=UPI00375196C5